MEYVMIIAFLAVAWLLFKCKLVNSRKWFVLLSVIVTMGILAYLIIDGSKQWNFRKTILLILVAGSVLVTMLRKAFAQDHRK